jgi:uncharacterized protein (TIGR02246 family)
LIGEKGMEMTIMHREVEAIVRGFEDGYAAAFGRKDAKALSDLLAVNATLLSEWGDVVQGQVKIEEMLAKVFLVMPRELRLVNTPSHSRMIAADVIVSHGVSHKLGEWGAGEQKLSYTRVLVRQDGKWRLAAAQIAPSSAMPDPRASLASEGGELEASRG